MAPVELEIDTWKLAGWDWEGPWELETAGDVDKEGWTYGVDFGGLAYPPVPGNQRKSLQHFVRRRRYFRRRRQISKAAPATAPTGRQKPTGNSEEEEEVERVVLGSVSPGESLPLPFGWRNSGQKKSHMNRFDDILYPAANCLLLANDQFLTV